MLVHQSKMAAMGEMIGAIAHQWRQPLNTLSLWLIGLRDHFQRGDMNGSLLDREIEQADYQIQFMSKTIDDFRNFFKPDKEREVFDVARAVQDVLKLLSAQIVKHRITIDFFCESGGKRWQVNLQEKPAALEGFTAYVSGYPNELKQVVLNLLNNAKDAILEQNKEGVITIALTKEEEAVRIVVEDNGGGIPETILEKIFDPYFSTKGEQGTGVGLDMAKTIVEENMEGTLTAENCGEGARFTILLSAVAEEGFEEAATAGEEKNEESTLTTGSSTGVNDVPAVKPDTLPETDTVDQESYLDQLFTTMAVGDSGFSEGDEALFAMLGDENGIPDFPEEDSITVIRQELSGLREMSEKLHRRFPRIRTFKEGIERAENGIRRLEGLEKGMKR